MCIRDSDERYWWEIESRRFQKVYQDLLLQASRGEHFSEVYSEVKIFTKDSDYTQLEVQLETLVEYCRDFETKLTINSIADISRKNNAKAKEHLV